MAAELEATRNDELRKQFFSLIAEKQISLVNINRPVLDLASEYRQQVIPDEYNDSIHIATATIFQFDAIISWNFKHIVNLNTMKNIHRINMKNGLPIIEIVSLNQLTEGRYESK